MKIASCLFVFLFCLPLSAAEQTSTKKARVYTLEDLERMPEITILGSETEEPGDSADQPDSNLTPSGESTWRKRARALQLKLQKQEDSVRIAEDACTEARMAPIRPSKRVVDLNQPQECAQLDDAKEKLDALETEWADFEAEARRAGVPQSWLLD